MTGRKGLDLMSEEKINVQITVKVANDNLSVEQRHEYEETIGEALALVVECMPGINITSMGRIQDE
jgi:hypothetical protein